MAFPIIGPLARKIFGSRNERMVKRYLRIVDQVSAQEESVKQLTDAELRGKTDEFRRRIKNGEKALDLVPEVFAVAREAMDRAVGIRNIFNPASGFDPSRLSADLRAVFDETKAKMDATAPAEPIGEFLGSSAAVPSWLFVDVPLPLYHAVRELHPESKPPFRARPFDVQIIGAMVLYEGHIAEMKTGEGKTIVAPLATYLAILEGKQVSVVTVNDYLVQRDRDWTFPFFRALGVTVGAIHPFHMQPHSDKVKAYQCNVVYGTTSEFGFDYLRDNMKLSTQEQVQKHRDFAIVDEVDSTLIDEARTPLIISGPAHSGAPRYDMADKLARHLMARQKDWNDADRKVQACKEEIAGLEGDIRNARDKGRIPELKARMDDAKKRLPQLEHERDKYTQYYEVEPDKKKAQLTHLGIAEAQREAGVGSFYVGDNIDLPHLLEQSIKAHAVYQRDRDYVVAPVDNEMSVVIVDQNTGRKMIGRQWSDGLHQAVEAKEGVPIKQETQTMATITIQNYFKLYKKLSGMTGTADTEATEFYEIYGLDVIVIPTNVPVVRVDRNDLVYIAEKDKWEAIVDEIKNFHDVGRPVLVGTTSVEKSERLSQMLTRKYTIKHEVLNAKQHEREADIIAQAGELGAVMIATNMAGRGTDIKLKPIDPQALLDHWKRRDLAPREVQPDWPEEKIIAAVYRHIAPKQLELRKLEVDAISDADLRLALLRRWVPQHTFITEGKAAGMSESALLSELDDSGTCLLHRLRRYHHTEDLGGLHVIATERHESRRIDNQLRGRSGRQGDQGSSRFFLSLEDDLMKMFAGPTTLAVLSKLGMKEGDAIEHPMLTRSVAKAQRKVEERNFLIRKHILEYDEVMNLQRRVFYGMRQDVLEGRKVKELIFDQIDDAVDDAVARYLDKNYAPNCMAEALREKVSIVIDADRLRGKDREELHRLILVDAKEEAAAQIGVVLGEYLPLEGDEGEADYKGLADWANANFKSGTSGNELRDLSRNQIVMKLEQAAAAQIDAADLGFLDQYLEPKYGHRELIKWATNKFGSEIKFEEIEKLEDPDDVARKLMEAARAAYRRREVTYPIDFALEMTSAQMPQDPQRALQQFCGWVKSRYELEWKPEALPSPNPIELRKMLVEAAEKWDGPRIAERARRAVAAGSSPEQLDQWFQSNMGAMLTEEEKEQAASDPQGVTEGKIDSILRLELAQFERWVLLQILDTAWKDHLHGIDQMRESIGLRAFAQKDSRIEYKREGAKLFEEMYTTIRDKVTDLVFKARLTVQAPPRPQAGDGQAAPRPQSAGGEGQTALPTPAAPRRPQVAQPSIAAAAAAASSIGTAAQRADIEAAERAGSPGSGGSGKSARPPRQPVKVGVTVGRNEPCPCGSGKKYKQCHGAKG